jgi:hypothetical protein
MPGRPFRTTTLAVALITAFGAGLAVTPASSGVLADFDTVTPGATATGGGDFAVDPIGSGRCADLSVGSSRAAGNAYCGGGGTRTFAFDLNGDADHLKFSFASFENQPGQGPTFDGDGPFGPDYFSVNLNSTELLRLEGQPTSGGQLEFVTLDQAVSSTFSNGDLFPANGVFQDFTVDLTTLGGPESEFVLSTTGTTEVMGLDSVSVPLPATLSILVAGLVGVTAAARSGRRRA